MSILSKINKYFESITASETIGIDFGTSRLRIGISGKGIVSRDPSFIGLNTKTHEYLFFGQEAKDIYGKTPPYLTIISPVEHSIISDFDGSVALVTKSSQVSVMSYYASQKFLRRGLIAYTTVPTSATEVEQRAARDVLIKSGFRSAALIPKPLAVASGAGYDIFAPAPCFVVDLGAGIFEIAILIMGGVVQSKVLKTAGNHMDKQIQNYLNLKAGLQIGELTAEEVKIKLLSMLDSKESMQVRGKLKETGLPKQIRVTASEVKEAVVSTFNALNEGIKDIIELAPPEVIDGILKEGIILTGAMAQIPGLAEYISNEVKFPVKVAPKPEEVTIMGIMRLIQRKDQLDKVTI